MLVNRIYLLLLFIFVFSQTNYPGSAVYHQNDCKGAFISMQFIPDRCFNSSSGTLLQETCTKERRISKMCRGTCERDCDTRVDTIRCTSRLANLCQPLLSTNDDGVTGTIYEFNRCQGQERGYVKSIGKECVSDKKLYCDKRRNLIIYEKYQYEGCQGEVNVREIRPGDCVMGVVYSIFMKFRCN